MYLHASGKHMRKDPKMEKLAANLDDLSSVTEELSDEPAASSQDVIDELREGLEEASDLADEIVNEQNDSADPGKPKSQSDR